MLTVSLAIQSSKQDGFSLMELLVVIAIIGILIAVAVPSYQTYTRRAHYTEIINALSPYKIAVEECYQITGSLTDCHSGQQGIPSATDSHSGGLIQNIRVTTDGVITAIPNNKYGITSEDTYVLTPMIKNNHLSWQSSGGAVNQGYVK